MAKISKTPTIISNMSHKTFDRFQKGIDFDSLFIRSGKGDIIYLSDLKIGDNNITSVEYFYNNFSKLNYNGTNISAMGVKVEDVFYRPISHTDVRTSHSSIENMSLATGARRTYSLSHVSELNPGEKRYGNDVVFLGRIKGYTSDTLLEAANIYYIHPATKARINLIELENVLKPTFKDFTHAIYMYEDKNGLQSEIESIDLRNAYTCKLTSYEVKTENGTIETHTIDEHGNDSVTNIRTTTASFVDKTAIASDESKGTTLIQNRLFNRNANGEFVAVQVKGQDHLIKVSLADLYDKVGNQIVPEGAELSPEEFDMLKGLELQIKTENGKMLEIEPLTIDNERYAPQKVLDISHNPEDIMADNAYLKLQNGQMFHESESNLQPKAYNIIDSASNADAYLIKLANGQHRIIDKELFEKEKLGIGKSYTVDGKVVEIQHVFKMCRTYAANAAVYQTTSVFGSKIHSCKLVKKLQEFDSLPDEFDEEQARAEAKEDFILNYQSGNYVLDKVEILDKDGNIQLQEVSTSKDEKGERYIYADTFDTEDISQSLGYYAALDNKPLEIQIKDGKISYVKGGPNYNITKGIKRDFAVWGKVALNSLGIFSTGGLAVAMVAPGLVAAGLAGVIAAPVIMPIVEIGRGLVSRISNSVKKSAWHTNVDLDKLDKNQDINHQTIAEIEQGMEHIKSQTEERLAQIDGDKSLTDEARALAKQDVLRKLNLECGLLQQKVATLSASTIEGSGFTITDGKGNVSSYNAYQCLMFQKQFNEKVDERNAIDKLVNEISGRLSKGKNLKKGQAEALDSLIEKYFPGEDFSSDNAKVEALQTKSADVNLELDAMQQDFTTGRYQAPPDSRYQEILDRSKNMQAYLIAKTHGIQLEDGTKVDNFMDNSLDNIANLQEHMSIIEEIKRDIDEFDLSSVLAGTLAEEIVLEQAEKLDPDREAEAAAEAMRQAALPGKDDISLVDAFNIMKSSEVDDRFVEKYPHYIRELGERFARYKYFEKLKEKESITITINGEKLTMTREEGQQVKNNFDKINNILKGGKPEVIDTEDLLDIDLIGVLINKMTELESIHVKFSGPDEELIGGEEDRAIELRRFYDDNHEIFEKALASQTISDKRKQEIKQAIEYYNHYGDYYPIGYNADNNNDEPVIRQDNNFDNTDQNHHDPIDPNINNNGGNDVSPAKRNETFTGVETLVEEEEIVPIVETVADGQNGNSDGKDETINLVENQKIGRIAKIKAALSDLLENIKQAKAEKSARKQEKKGKENETKLKLGEAFSKGAKAVKDFGAKAGRVVKNAGVAAGSAVKKAAITAGSTVKKGAITAGSAVKKGAITAGSTVKKGAITAGSAVKKGAVTAGSAVKKGAITAGRTVKNFAVNIASTIKKDEITLATIVDELKDSNFNAEEFCIKHEASTISEVEYAIFNFKIKEFNNLTLAEIIEKYRKNDKQSPYVDYAGAIFYVDEFDTIKANISSVKQYQSTFESKEARKKGKEKLVYNNKSRNERLIDAIEYFASDSFDPEVFDKSYGILLKKIHEIYTNLIVEFNKNAKTPNYVYSDGDIEIDKIKFDKMVKNGQKYNQYKKDKKTSVATNNENADVSSGISEERISEIENADSTDQENKGRSRKKKRKEDKTREIQDAKQEAEDKRKQADLDAISAIKDDKLRKLCQDLLSETGIFVNDLIDKYSDAIDKLSIVLSSKHSVSQDGLFDILTFDNNEIVEISLKGYQQIIKNMQILIEAKKERENKKVEEWSQSFVDSVDQINNILDKNNSFKGLTLGNFYEPAYNQLIAGLDKLDSKKQLEFVEKYEKVLDYIKYKISDPLITTQILENDQAVVNLSDSYQVTITQETLKKLLEEFKNVDEIKSNRAFTQ